MNDLETAGEPIYSVVVPFYNEAETAAGLIAEIEQAMQSLGEPWELLMVDDGSRDATGEILQQAAAAHANYRRLRLPKNRGQAAALCAGMHRVRGRFVVTMDGDGQNDPADLPHMLDTARRLGVDCVTGVRAKRQDNFIRKFSSRVGNGFRNWATGDRVTDSGCGVRVVRAACTRELPVFNGLHRFMPTLLRSKGYVVAEHPVNHRPRLRGVSKYGVHNRLWRGIRDCFGVRWFAARAVPAERVEGMEQGQGR